MAITTFDDIQNGYRGLAGFIAPQLDAGLGMFKRFAHLNTLNLLYLQAEILGLEQEIKISSYLDERDDNCGSESRRRFARSVRAMKNQPGNLQWEKILEVRPLLKEYNQALLQQAEIARLNKAREYDRGIVQHWVQNPAGGNSFLSGSEAQPWLPNNLNDLVAVSNRASNDTFTRWIEEKALPWLYWIFFHPFKKPIKGQEETRLVNFEASNFTRLARIMTICFSALLPSLAVLGLYFINRLTARLGAIIAFSAMFSLVLALFTNARPIEIFTATASFAAVQVVFVGGTDQCDLGKYLLVVNATTLENAPFAQKVALKFSA